MNLRVILGEMSEDVGGNSKGTRRRNNIALSTTTTPLEQVEWAIRYAEHRYGSACAGWTHWQKEYWW